MGLISVLELLLLVSVIGLLIILGVRLKIKVYNVLLLLIIAFLFLALVSLGKLTLNLLGASVLLGILCILFAVRRYTHE